MSVKNEGLTSFAENPTKSVERDALVESSFTAPEAVEKTNVTPKWPWCRSKCDTWLQKYMILIFLCFMILALIVVAIVLLVIFNSHTTTPHETPVVYTLPSEAPDTSTAHAQMLLPAAALAERPVISPKLAGVTTSTTEPVELILSTEEDFYPTTPTTELITTTTTQHTRPTTPTRSFFTSTSYMDFHQNVHGEKPATCLERLALGSPSGITTITFKKKSFEAYCDMDITDGGWTVIQRRDDRNGHFHKRTMNEYAYGFGDLKGNHWLGLEKLALLAPVTYAPAVLRIEIEGETCNEKCTQRYSNKWVGEWPVQFGVRKDWYPIFIGPMTTGNLTSEGRDPLFEGSNGHSFTSVDNDKDENRKLNCANFRMLGAWWHGAHCSDVALNGYYPTTREKYEVSASQNHKRYFIWAYEGQKVNGVPYVIHIRKSTMLLKSMILEKK